MKKKITFILFFSVGISTLIAQGFNLPTDYIRNSAQGNNLNLAKIDGTPYLPVDFTLGKVNINKESYSGLLRYNAYNDEIELKENDGKVISLLKRPYIKAFIANDAYSIHKYTNGDDKIKQGYLVEISNPEANTVLLMKLKKVLLPAQESTSSYRKDSPAKLIDEISYYVKEGENPAKRVKLGKRNVLSFFKNNPKLKSYVSKNKLKLKSEKQLITFIDYINTI